MTRKVLYLCILTMLISCARAPIKQSHKSLRYSSAPQVSDEIASLTSDLEVFLRNSPQAFLSQSFTYQDQTWKGEDVFKAYKDLHSFLKQAPSLDELNQYIKQNFDYYEVYGAKKWGDVFVTSYFEPVYQGSLSKTKKHSLPILKKPDDLIEVDLKAFAHTHKQLQPHYDYILKNEKGPRLLRGKLQNKKVIPYLSRSEIETKTHPKTETLAWMDPIDLFFLQIQGSGTLSLANGQEHTIAYAGQNGHQYVAIGKFLTDVIPLKEMTASKIEEHLRSLPLSEAQAIIHQNPSYVFFEKRQGRPLTSQGTPVIDGRSIATDSFHFPKGLIAYLDLDLKDLDTKIQRFVFNQDSGGAINGPGRVDLFWGRGKDAGEMAGKIKHRGKLWFLLPKIESL